MNNENDYVLEVPQGFLLSDEAAMDTEGGSTKTHFAILRFIRKAVTGFQKGQSTSIPGVFNDKEDKANGTWIRQGLKEFKAVKAGGKSSLNALVATKTTKDGREYQISKVYKSWTETDQNTGEKSFDWHNFQLPELRKLPADTLATFESGKPIYVQFESLATGRRWKGKNQETQEEIEGDATYWGNFKVYPTLEALKAAEKEFFGQFQNGSNGASSGVDLSNFPKIWWNDRQTPAEVVNGLYTQIRTVKDGKFVEKATELMLIGPNGQPVEKVGKDEPIDLAGLFATAMDVPLTEDITQAFSHLYK